MRRGAAESFAAAWARRDPAGMWLMLDKRSRAAYPRARFVRLVRSAESAATVQSVRVGRVSEPRGGGFALPLAIPTRIFGTLRGTVVLPVHDEDGAARIAWAPHLRLPGLRAGEQVRRVVLSQPTRAEVLGADGRPLAGNPATAALAGRAPTGSDPGSGLERLYDARLAGRPGAQLRFGERVIVTVKRRPGARSTRRSVPACSARPRRRSAALGGVAVIRPRDGSVLALAAWPSPRPAPGSTFKIITLSRRSSAGIATPSTPSGPHVRDALGRPAAQRRRRVVRRLADASVHRLVQLGVRAPGREARRPPPGAHGRGLRLQRAPARARRQGEHDPAGARAEGHPRGRRHRHRPGSRPRHPTADGGGGGDHRGARAPRAPADVRNDKVLRRRVVSARVAAQVREMMLGVVRSGTGRPPPSPASGRRQDRHRRAAAGNSTNPKDTDAWFVAFAPASNPRSLSP